MKTRRIELKLRNREGIWDMEGVSVYTLRNKILPFLCTKTLAKYFDLEDKPEYITVVLSDTPTKKSYFVTCNWVISNGMRWSGVYEVKLRLTLSSGRCSNVGMYPEAMDILRKYPKGCYVSIEA